MLFLVEVRIGYEPSTKKNCHRCIGTHVYILFDNVTVFVCISGVDESGYTELTVSSKTMSSIYPG